MDHFRRLIALIALLAVVPGLRAEVMYHWSGSPTLLRTTPEAACKDNPTLPDVSYPGIGGLQGPAELDYASRTANGYWNCMVGATRISDGYRVRWLNGGVYEKTVVPCVAPLIRLQDGTCGPSPCPPSGTTEGDSSNAVQTAGTNPSSTVCIGGCVWKGGGSVPSGCLNGKCYTFGPFTATGGQCTATEGGTGDPAEPVPESEAGCAKKGQGSITVNGTTTCVPNTKSESQKESSEETKNDNGEPTKTDKKSTTKCEGSKCTTTTEETTTGPGGTSSTKTTTTEEPKQDYCQKNPTALECQKDETKWGGTCESQFVCDGDAVQCAQAQAGWQAACSLKTDRSNSAVIAGQAAIDGSDKAGIESGLGKGQAEAFTLSGLISTTPIFGSTGGCIGDSSVSVGGVSVAVPFSLMCGMLNQIGIALQAFAYLVAAFIVFRRG